MQYPQRGIPKLEFMAEITQWAFTTVVIPHFHSLHDLLIRLAQGLLESGASDDSRVGPQASRGVGSVVCRPKQHPAERAVVGRAGKRARDHYPRRRERGTGPDRRDVPVRRRLLPASAHRSIADVRIGLGYTGDSHGNESSAPLPGARLHARAVFERSRLT
jgi:hypothetical protein